MNGRSRNQIPVKRGQPAIQPDRRLRRTGKGARRAGNCALYLIGPNAGA